MESWIPSRTKLSFLQKICFLWSSPKKVNKLLFSTVIKGSLSRTGPLNRKSLQFLLKGCVYWTLIVVYTYFIVVFKGSLTFLIESSTRRDLGLAQPGDCEQAVAMMAKTLLSLYLLPITTHHLLHHCWDNELGFVSKVWAPDPNYYLSLCQIDT